MGPSRAPVLDVKSVMSISGKIASAGCSLHILRQPEAGDIESNAEGRQLDEGARNAQTELAHQVRRKGFRVAQSGDIRSCFLGPAAVGGFSREGNVQVRARLRRNLVAKPEKEPVLVTEGLVRSREILLLQSVQSEIPRPVDSQRRGKGERRFRIVR